VAQGDAHREGQLHASLMNPDARPQMTQHRPLAQEPISSKEEEVGALCPLTCAHTHAHTHARTHTHAHTHTRYMRVHVHPKRFPAAYKHDWRSRILAVTEDYVVVDKPPGIQVRSGACDDPCLPACVRACVRASMCVMGKPPGILASGVGRWPELKGAASAAGQGAATDGGVLVGQRGGVWGGGQGTRRGKGCAPMEDCP